MSSRSAVMAKQRFETLDEWTLEARQGRYVTRGELMWFMQLADEAQRRRAHDSRWYRRCWRAMLRPFRGRVAVEA